MKIEPENVSTVGWEMLDLLFRNHRIMSVSVKLIDRETEVIVDRERALQIVSELRKAALAMCAAGLMRVRVAEVEMDSGETEKREFFEDTVLYGAMWVWGTRGQGHPPGTGAP